VTLDDHGLTLCVVGLNPLAIALQSNGGYHKYKSSVISIPNACIQIIEFTVNCLCAVMWIICCCPCM